MDNDNVESGEQLLPVCISEVEIKDLLSSLDLMRVMGFGGDYFPAFRSVLEAIPNYGNMGNSPCFDVGTPSSNCFTIPTTSSGMQFFYNNPFEPIENQPRVGKWTTWEQEKLRQPKWVANLLELTEDINFFDSNIGYFENDCFVVLPDEKVGLFGGVQTFLDFITGLVSVEIPHVRIEFQGDGQLEIELLSVPFGGSAMIRYDNDGLIDDAINAIFDGNSDQLQNTIITELQRDIVSIPPELKATNVIEIDFNDETPNTEHYVTVYFLPRFNDELTGLAGIGGGIRSVSACGNISIKNIEKGTLINSENYGLEQHRRKGIIMATKQDICEGVICALEAVSGRIVSGQAGNITSAVEIASSGGITVKSIGGGGVAGGVNRADVDALRIAYGGAIGQAKGFKKVFDTLNNRITDSWLDANIKKAVSYLINIADSSLAFLDLYITDDPQTTIDTDLLAQKIHCASDFYAGVFEYADENHSEEDFNYIISLSAEIPITTIQKWYEEGTGKPSDGYQSSECYLMPNETVVFDVDLLANDQYAYFSSQQMLSAPRSWAFKFSGSVTNANGDIWDGLYLVQGSTETYTPPTIRRDPALTLGLVSTPNYNPEHAYTVETDDNTNALHRIDYVGYSNSTLVDEFRAVGGLSGEITVTKIDLGVD